MGIQTIKTPNGEDMVILPRSEYLSLLARAGDEATEDELDALIAAEARTELSLSAETSRMILDGVPFEDAIGKAEKA
jgi:hypothetical protein